MVRARTIALVALALLVVAVLDPTYRTPLATLGWALLIFGVPVVWFVRRVVPPPRPIIQAARASTPPAQPTPVASPAEARATIAALRIRKRELQLERREAVSMGTDESQRWRQRQAGRVPNIRGRGVLPSLVRGSRSVERQQHAAKANRIGNVKQQIDAAIIDVDRQILVLERYILEHR